MSAGLRSGQVAEAAGVNIQTLRYYERRGLLAEPEPSNGGHRLYGEDAVTALRVIKAAQRLGFTLEEVAELLEAGRHRHGRPVAGLQERAAAKLADLTTIRAALATAVEAGCDDLTVCAGSACCPSPSPTSPRRTAMPAPAADPRPHRTPKALEDLAALACVACCALPLLITAGVVGTGAGAVVGWLPALAVVLAVLAAGTWWLGQRRSSCSCSCSCSCAPKAAGDGGCGCKASGGPLKITGAGRRQGPAV
ncbi:MerR family transcriptional regulator [Streptomyces sp. NPDC090077]|uniref:MerR family transcriptional regulator n=1 Tax=Streptomyces sp. NPDC090077 TaxID=3365938 RepID=UPI0038124E2B